MCASRRYYESQTTSPGSATSLVLPLSRLNSALPAAGCRLPAAGRWCFAATGGMSQFMYFSESKPKFLSPNSFSTMAQITPTTVSLWKYKTRQRTDKKHLRYSVCIHTHTCGARTVESHWRANVSGRARQSKGRSRDSS